MRTQDINKPWNKAHGLSIEVEHGTISETQYGCAGGCGQALCGSDVTWVSKGRLKSYLKTPFGSLVHRILNPRYSLPYCTDCYTAFKQRVNHKPRVKTVDDRYNSMNCGVCKERKAETSMRSYVLNPKAKRKKGTDGAMHAPIYVRGNTYRCICEECFDDVENEFMNRYTKEQIKEMVDANRTQ